jgi:hypothetical protein
MNNTELEETFIIEASDISLARRKLKVEIEALHLKPIDIEYSSSYTDNDYTAYVFLVKHHQGVKQTIKPFNPKSF